MWYLVLLEKPSKSEARPSLFGYLRQLSFGLGESCLPHGYSIQLGLHHIAGCSLC